MWIADLSEHQQILHEEKDTEKYSLVAHDFGMKDYLLHQNLKKKIVTLYYVLITQYIYTCAMFPRYEIY